MTNTPDPDQKAVYYAEEVSFGGTLFGEPLHTDELLELADELFTTGWWDQYKIPVPQIEPTTSKDTSSKAICMFNVKGGSIIRLAPSQIDPWTLAHEVAHVAQFYFYNVGRNPGLESHGREFRACYLITAEILLGRDAANELRLNFKRRLPVRPEHAPGQPGWIVTVPPLNPAFDPEGVGIYPRWRRRKLIAEHATLQERLYTTYGPSADRINGAIAL